MNNIIDKFPTVGTDATMAIGTDCYPYHVVYSNPKKNLVGVVGYQEEPNAEGSIYSGDCMKAAHAADGTPLLENTIVYLKLTKKGFKEAKLNKESDRWVLVGGGSAYERWSFGYARSYRDPSF